MPLEGDTLIATMLLPLLTRRRFLAFVGASTAARGRTQAAESIHFNVAEFDRARILSTAADAMKKQPLTIPSLEPPVKLPNPNTYFSHDVEWLATDDGKGYERRPGRMNPAAYSQHRDALIGMNGVVGACVAAWRLTGEKQYATHAMQHLRAWFVDAATRMEPNLDHACCVPGSATGTYRGVEDTITLAETIRAASFLCSYNGVATDEEAAGLRTWCKQFCVWMNEGKAGFIARESKDRAAICWTLQVAEMARFTRDPQLLLECGHRFRDKLLRQMNFDGQFPLDLRRPDAYAASIFTLECLSLACDVLSTPMDSLWSANLPDGRGMRSAIAFLFPALENRAAWRQPADPEHFTAWPVRQASLLLAGRAYSRPEYLALWKRLPAEPRTPELLRFLPMRQPALWTVRPPA